MDNLTTAARMGRAAGIAYRETRRVVSMIDWAEVGTIVLHGLVVAAVLTYHGGLLTGRAVHRANDHLAAAWVRLWVGTPSELPIESQLGDAPTVEAPVATVEPVRQTMEPQRVTVAPVVVTAELARQMMAEGMSQRAVSRELQIPRTTLRRMLQAA